ncbi:UNVERIFIED_CONTAM: hypothetical protein Slati_1033800 [Sesamum latifolium]|uniref:Uncharacterized protein n=1 Tax=Sesamum latifolium TaxID=2727402 RepID=A0AAW2XW43_9LAMI
MCVNHGSYVPLDSEASTKFDENHITSSDSCQLKVKGKEPSIFENQEEKQREVEGLGSNLHARDRSQYVSSVLNPVENLSQWKAVKAKTATPQLKYQKENSMLKQEGQNDSSTRADSDPSAFQENEKSERSSASTAYPLQLMPVYLTGWALWRKNHHQEWRFRGIHLRILEAGLNVKPVHESSCACKEPGFRVLDVCLFEFSLSRNFPV